MSHRRCIDVETCGVSSRSSHSIHFFKYSLVRSDFEILDSSIVENSKQRISFNSIVLLETW